MLPESISESLTHHGSIIRPINIHTGFEAFVPIRLVTAQQASNQPSAWAKNERGAGGNQGAVLP
jgi:hypothetical protein